MLDNQTIVSFQEKIRKRRETHRRDLPWRKTQDPYKIRMSETMLCQTQVSRVLEYYKRRLSRFPDVESLAGARNEEVLKLWSGLGYNSRALRLKEAAKRIISTNIPYQDFMNNYNNLISLPGVGDYISNAILAFAYNKDVTVMDTNIRRIMIYEFCSEDFREYSLSAQQKIITGLIQETLPVGKARDRYNALMDYGAGELTAKKSGISPPSKQSKFHGSARQARAGIIKYILGSTTGYITKHTIAQLYPEREDLDQIIHTMLKDSLIIECKYGYAIYDEHISPTSY